MSLYITSLNSGSNGNCYYVGNGKEAILVDAGISCREIEKRMNRLGLSMQIVKAIFVSHEHTDHIRGIASLVKKYRLPVYITLPTLLNGKLLLDKHLLMTFVAHQQITIGDITVTAFPKQHDAVDPYSFIIESNNIKVGVFTDIGAPCKHVIHYFKQCHAAFLEANYDNDMLDSGSYPYYLKKRIKGGNGHLSNSQALELFITYKPTFMSHLFLSHLSQNNNCPNLVKDLFNKHAGTVNMIVASRYQETDVYPINNIPVRNLRPSRKSVSTSQLAFAFVQH
jgi:phosphoribosyl 1,2-cyclic phosphodiesterase